MLGLATIANMGAEVGATTSTFPYTHQMRAYLNATGRAPVARAADAAALEGLLSADEGAEYDEVIEIVRNCLEPLGFALIKLQNLSDLEPTINGPFTPDLATPISKFGSFVKSQGWKDEFSAALIGSCTNSSYEDMVYHHDILPSLRRSNPTYLDKCRVLGSAGKKCRAYSKGKQFKASCFPH
jgi:homoaconitase